MNSGKSLARRHEHLRPRLLAGLQALDRILEIGVAAQEALGARGEQERESELACRFHRGGDALGRLADVEQRLVLAASGRGVLERRADEEAYGRGLEIGLGKR